MLGTRKESWSQNTAHFLKELSNHALRIFKHPAPVARGIVKLEDPMKYLGDEFPTKAKCMEKLGVRLAEAEAGEKEVDRLKREAENEDILASVNMKRDTTTSNFTTLWGIIMGQCTKALIADITTSGLNMSTR